MGWAFAAVLLVTGVVAIVIVVTKIGWERDDRRHAAEIAEAEANAARIAAEDPEAEK